MRSKATDAVWLLFMLACAALGRTGVCAQIAGTTGGELFHFYCASCHGQDGKGGGPTARALKLHPADLTTIAKRHGGTFPAAQLKLQIAGPQGLFIPAHGSSDMPVWGPVFRALDPSGDNERRVQQLVDYLDALQEK